MDSGCVRAEQLVVHDYDTPAHKIGFERAVNGRVVSGPVFTEAHTLPDCNIAHLHSEIGLLHYKDDFPPIAHFFIWRLGTIMKETA